MLIQYYLYTLKMIYKQVKILVFHLNIPMLILATKINNNTIDKNLSSQILLRCFISEVRWCFGYILRFDFHHVLKIFSIVSYEILPCLIQHSLRALPKQEDKHTSKQEMVSESLERFPSYTFLRVYLYRYLTCISYLIMRVLENYHHHSLALAGGIGNVL